VPRGQRGWEWRHLKQQTDGGIFTLPGHTHRVSCVAFSRDGTRIATAGQDQSRPGEVMVWDARTGSLLLELDGIAPMRVANIPVLGVAFSPDGTRLAAAGGVTGAGEATVRDAKTRKDLLELKAQAGRAARRRAGRGAWRSAPTARGSWPRGTTRP